MLYERAKEVLSKGLSAEDIQRVLLGEGASEQDIKVILGSLGLGPQPHPDPTQQPLALARRVMESRGLRLAVSVIGAAAVAGLLYVFWIVATVVWSLVEGFTRGR